MIPSGSFCYKAYSVVKFGNPLKNNLFLLFLLIGMVLSGSCGIQAITTPIPVGPSHSTFTNTEQVDNAVYINYEQSAFVPAQVSIPVDTEVIWQVSEDYAHHWVVCDAVPFRGWFYEWFSFRYIFTEPGTYAYYDGADPTVTGSVTVY